jgi:REP element-mobilizing transposase RayT
MKRRFCAGGVLHVYQRTVSGFNIFYSLEDFLVFYTIISVKAKKFKVNLLGLCLMVDHIHMLITGDNISQISLFVSEYTSVFVREFNSWTGRTGALFESAFGSSIKTEIKKIRSAIAYLFNNPVEKMLCRNAEEYRWNFLSYYNPSHKLPHKKIKEHSRAMRRAIEIVNSHFARGMYLKHALLETLYGTLDGNEKELLTEHIIRKYLPFDIETTNSYYRSYEDMVKAINSNTGSEYDIRERHYCKTDAPYREMITVLKKAGWNKVQDVIVASEEEKRKLHSMLKSKTSASGIQIRKFLHIRQHDTAGKR